MARSRSVAGCLPWTAALAVGGYVVGANWRSLEEAMRGPSYVVALVCLAAGAALAYLAVHRHHMSDEILSGADISDPTLAKR